MGGDHWESSKEMEGCVQVVGEESLHKLNIGLKKVNGVSGKKKKGVKHVKGDLWIWIMTMRSHTKKNFYALKPLSSANPSTIPIVILGGDHP